jgi:hypothetical protein
MLVSLFLSIYLLLGHYFFYYSLDGKPKSNYVIYKVTG